eukprot:scaffold59296_cov23-Cyclotella_meneghiniana.AAC.2
MAIFFEVRLRHHHGVAAATEVCCVTELFGEEVAGVDDPSSFVGYRRGPLDACVVIVVNSDAVVGVGHEEVEGAVADVFKLGHTFGRCDDFSFAGAEGGAGSAVRHCITELAAPACVGEGGETLHITWGRGSGVVVSFFVMHPNGS